jgi:hypothetical protein
MWNAKCQSMMILCDALQGEGKVLEKMAIQKTKN